MLPVTEPDFCLLIPCYNNEKGLIESLNSVVYDTDKYIVVIVDDGSDTALEEERIKAGLKRPAAFVLLHNERNAGITYSLNKGLDWIAGNTTVKYIARLDCGDICMPERFIKQVDYLNRQEEVVLLGSWCRFRNKKSGQSYLYKTPSLHKEIIREMHFRNVFIHPAVMFRLSAVQKKGLRYPDNFIHAEDYAFFWTLINTGQSFIQDECLVICELNSKGISYKNRGKQLVSRMRVVNKFSIFLPLKILSYLRLSVLYIIPSQIIFYLRGRDL